MINILIYSVLGFILVMLVMMTYHFNTLQKLNARQEDADSGEERISLSQGYIYTSLILIIVVLILFTWYLVKGTPREGHLMEWLNIVVRLMHITFGIAWIGASFYFVFLENALNRTEDVRDELAGNLWAVHGGGFYYLEKYKVAPKTIPKHLHWFKYEAYFTWVSGFCLLFVVYYFNASAFLIDKNILDISPLTGISIGIGSFIIAWLIYDLLCKSPLSKKGSFKFIGFIIAIGFAWFYCRVFSARAAFIHFGAMLGTLMVANVFFIIIPAQKAMVKAAKQGLPLNPQLGKNALSRSLHNNYFTLPVLFVMVSNHFPSTFGYQYPWAILGAITLGTAGVKHYLNLKEKGQYNVWVLPVSVFILLSACFISAPPAKLGECNKKISINEVTTIINKRCIQCHSKKPTDDVISAPPNGVVYETPADIVKLKDKIMDRVVINKSMPQNNKTNITQEERDILRCWIEQGALVK